MFIVVSNGKKQTNLLTFPIHLNFCKLKRECSSTFLKHCLSVVWYSCSLQGYPQIRQPLHKPVTSDMGRLECLPARLGCKGTDFMMTDVLEMISMVDLPLSSGLE